MTHFSTCFSWGRGWNKPRECSGLPQLQTFPFALIGQTSSQGTGLGAYILGEDQRGAAGAPAPPLSCGFSLKSLMSKGALFPGTFLPLANAPPFLSLLQRSAGGKGKQNTSFLF